MSDEYELLEVCKNIVYLSHMIGAKIPDAVYDVVLGKPIPTYVGLNRFNAVLEELCYANPAIVLRAARKGNRSQKLKAWWQKRQSTTGYVYRVS